MDPYEYQQGFALTRPLYVVAVYVTGRQYGGPEEGGWWFTVGELEGIIDSTFDEDAAYAAAYAFNRPAELGGDHREDYLEARVVELGRTELRPEVAEDLCHSDYDPVPADYIRRYDVPRYFPEYRQHYC